MWFWNRVEIYCGYLMKDFADLRDSLASKGIKYDYRMVYNNGHTNRVHHVSSNQDKTTLYYLYVHKKDYDNAMFLTSNRHR